MLNLKDQKRLARWLKLRELGDERRAREAAELKRELEELTKNAPKWWKD